MKDELRPQSGGRRGKGYLGRFDRVGFAPAIQFILHPCGRRSGSSFIPYPSSFTLFAVLAAGAVQRQNAAPEPKPLFEANMRILAVLLFFAFFFLFTTPARAQLAKPQVADNESGLDKVQLIKNDEVLYNMKWSWTRRRAEGQTFLICKIVGDNGKRGAERIDWTEESKIEELPDRYRTLSWKKTSTGAEQMDWEMHYDWDAGKATYAFTDRATGKKENKTLRVDPDTIAGDATYIALRGFPFEKGPGASIVGKLCNTDGTLLTGQIILRGEEKLSTPLGTIDTYKLELKPQGLVGMLPTKLFMWFTKDAPHRVVRFDGFEGLSRTKTVVHEYNAK